MVGMIPVPTLLRSVVVALFVALIAMALSAYGIVDVNVARALMLLAWVIAVFGVWEYFSTSRRVVKIGFPVACGLALAITFWSFDAWVVKHKQADSEAQRRIPTPAEIASEIEKRLPLKTEPSSRPQAPLEKTSQVAAPLILEPALQIALGAPFQRTLGVTIKNAGVDPIVDAATYARCFLLAHLDDPNPTLLFYGIEMIDHSRAWWRIGTLDAGASMSHSAKETVENCLTIRDHNDQAMTMLPPVKEVVFVVDLLFRRTIDHKQYRQHGIMHVVKDKNTGEVLFWPPTGQPGYYEYLVTSRCKSEASQPLFSGTASWRT